MSRHKSKKHQSRLDFSSLPPSSPASKHRATENMDSSSPLKRKRPVIEDSSDDDDDDEDADQTALPTPETLPSSTKHSAKTSSTQAPKRTRVQQGRLDFSHHIGITVPKSPSATAPKQRLRARGGRTFGNHKSRVETSNSSEEDEKYSDSNNSSDIVVARRRQSTQTVDSSSEFDTIPREKPFKRLQRTRPPNSDPPDSEDDFRLRRTPRKVKAKEPKHKDTLDFGDAESSGDEVFRSPLTHQPKPRRRGGGHTSSDPENSEEDDEDISMYHRTRKDAPVSVSKGSRSHHNERRHEEHEDLAADLEFLQSSPPPAPTSTGRLRSAAPPKLNARQMALEALKRRREGGSADLPHDEAGEDEDEDEDEDQGEEEDADSEIDSDIEVQDDPAGIEDLEEEDDFIVEEEEEGTIGVPDMPLAFSAQSRMKPKELFPYAVEWMVHKRINPTFEMNDEIYLLAFQRLEDEVQGLAGSKYKSSIWKRDFRVALDARPHVEITDMGNFLGEEGCQACGRGSHPATFVMRFSGKPYHKKTLDDVADIDSDEEDSLEPEYDSSGKEVPHAGRQWNVGKFCKANAETAHTLEHWRYNLYEWIVDWLEREGHLSPEKVVKRDRLPMNKRRKVANQLVDQMEEKQQIRALYNDFRTQVNAARDTANTYTRWR